MKKEELNRRLNEHRNKVKDDELAEEMKDIDEELAKEKRLRLQKKK